MCVCVCVSVCVYVCVAKPVAVDLRCHATALIACNEHMHESLDVFEFRPDPTTDTGVNCP